jgi:hypothetical protein
MFAESEELCSQGAGSQSGSSLGASWQKASSQDTSSQGSDPTWTPGSSQQDSQPPKEIPKDRLFLVTFAAILSLFT